MERIQLTEDLSFSRIIHGLWRLADWEMTKEQRLTLIEQCLALGVTTFDHADIYGSYTCEALFGEALSLKPSLRQQMELVTKCGIVLQSPQRPMHQSHHYNTSKAHIIASVETSLRNFGTDYIDTLLIHRPDPLMNPEEVAAAFDELHKAGKVRTFGVSNFKDHQLRMLQSYVAQPLITNQIELSVLQLENLADGTVNLCLEKRMKPMIWSPLAQGAIFSAETEQALRLRQVLTQIAAEIGANTIDEVMYTWLLSHPAQMMPIIGSSKIDRVKLAVNAVQQTMTRDQWFAILHASMGYEVP